jgi:hypothetical protein
MEQEFNPEMCKMHREYENERIKRLEETLPRIFQKLEQFSQRPSWITASIIVFLASGLAISVTVILGRFGGK